MTEEQLASVPAKGSKLMPDDIDAYLSGGSREAPYAERAMSQKQRLTASRLVRANQLVVPGTMSMAINWEPIEYARAMNRANGDSFQPSAFTMFAFAVVQAMKEFPAIRTTLVGESTLRTYDHVDLGIAVALPGDELVLAVVDEADTMDWRSFAARTREQIELARTGQDQAKESVTLSLTNMQAFKIRDAVPVVVPPSVATLFLGEVYNGLSQEGESLKLQRTANIAMTFDHRLMNGAGAAEFMIAVSQKIEMIGSLAL